jgi:hypothetical protein
MKLFGENGWFEGVVVKVIPYNNPSHPIKETLFRVRYEVRMFNGSFGIVIKNHFLSRDNFLYFFGIEHL